MSGRYGYKDHKDTPVRRFLADGIRLVAMPFGFVQAFLNVVADILVDRRRHVYSDREV